MSEKEQKKKEKELKNVPDEMEYSDVKEESKSEAKRS